MDPPPPGALERLRRYQQYRGPQGALIAAALAFARQRLASHAYRNFENNVFQALQESFGAFREFLGTHFDIEQVRHIVSSSNRAGDSDTPPESIAGDEDPGEGPSNQIERPQGEGQSNMDTGAQRDSVVQRRRTANDAGLGDVDPQEAGDARAGGGGRAGGATGGGGTGQVAPLCTDYRQFCNVRTNSFSKRTFLSMIAFKPIYKLSTAAQLQGFYAHCCYVFIPHQNMWTTRGVSQWLGQLMDNGHNVTWKNIRMKLKQINMTATFATATNAQGVVNSAPTSVIGHARGLEQELLIQNKIAETNADNSGLSNWRNGAVNWQQLEQPSSGPAISGATVGTVGFGQGSSNFQRYAQIAVTPMKVNQVGTSGTYTLDPNSVYDMGSKFPMMTNIQAAGTIFDSYIDSIQMSHQRTDAAFLFPITGPNNGSPHTMPGFCQDGISIRPEQTAAKIIQMKTTEENTRIAANQRLVQGMIHPEAENYRLKCIPNDYVHMVPAYGTDPTEIQPVVFYGVFEASAELAIDIDLFNNRNYVKRVTNDGQQTSTKTSTLDLDQTVYKGIPACNDGVDNRALKSPLIRDI